MPKLSDETIAARMTEWRNLKQLHKRDRAQIVELKQRVRTLEQEKTDDRAYFESLIQKQAIQIAELQTMVFGRKRKPPTGTGVPVVPVSPKSYRSKDSRRPVPPASTVTKEVVVPLPEFCACGGRFDLTSISLYDRYEEDLPLPELTEGYIPHLVTKYAVARGTCIQCGKATSGRELGGAEVSLGPNVRLLVAHLTAGIGMSYAQVVDLLFGLYGLRVTDGEMAHMLQKQHIAWTPSYTKLKNNIRAAPVIHVDETPWPIQSEANGYAWVLADAGSPRVYFELATSRGALHARRLFGQDTDQPFTGVRVSDDYGPYRNPKLPGAQQLCWAHLNRTIRDIRYNANLPKGQAPYVTQWYAGKAGIYQDLRSYLIKPYDKGMRQSQATALWEQLQALALQPKPPEGEPDKLTRLKTQLLRAGHDRLFTCLTRDTPCDNNRAERDLRQLVLKRKRSFGSKTEKGAKALATILSVCTTTWRSNPAGYFKELATLAG